MLLTGMHIDMTTLENCLALFTKADHHTASDSSSFLNIYPIEMHAHVHQETHIIMFTAVSLKKPKSKSNPNDQIWNG